MMDRPLIGTADWHLLDGSHADESCREGIRWVFRESAVYRPVAYAWLGDMLDCWIARAETIIARNRDLFAWIDEHLASQPDPAPVWYVRGNHDGYDIESIVAQLRVVMPRTTIVSFSHVVSWEGWTLMHGHQLDPSCHGVFGALASVATGCAGLVERIVPGFDAQLINPMRLVTPAREANPALQNAIREAADRYAARFHSRVLHGHTHRRRISLDRQVVCAGTCQGPNKGEFAAVWPDGLAVIHEMCPEPYEKEETPCS